MRAPRGRHGAFRGAGRRAGLPRRPSAGRGGAGADSQGGANRCDHPALGRERHREGDRRPSPPRAEQAGRRAVRRAELRRRLQRPSGVRDVRPHAGCVHRRSRVAQRPLPVRQGRHHVPRRDRRDVAGAAGQAVAGPSGARGDSSRVGARRQGRRPHHRREQPPARQGGGGGAFPRGSVLSPERHPARAAVAAGAALRHPVAHRTLPARAERPSPDDRLDHRAGDGGPRALRLAGQRARAREHDRAPGRLCPRPAWSTPATSRAGSAP